MKYFYSLLLACAVFAMAAAPGDTTWVSSHNKTDMTWYETYSDTASFPTTTTSYHKILMYYTLGCATGGCSDWDYTTRVYLMKATGAMDSNVTSIDTLSTNPLVIDTTWNVFEVKEPFELARVITPYGGNLKNNWTHEFMYDVTDFYPLMKGDVEIRVHYQGWSSGFSATVKFAMIEGTPAREVIKVENLYQGHGDYITSAAFESNNLPSRVVSIDTATKGSMIRANFSGHGFINSLNCAEFCEKDYFLTIDGIEIFRQPIWRDDCGLNPLWPQAGTWLYDRANWCPGDRSLFRNHEVFLPPGNVGLDIDIEAYTYTVPPGEVPAGYNYAVQLFQYKAPSFQNDVELERTLAPSSEDESGRMNPACSGAVVRIRNKGEQTLTSCTIEYGMDGGDWKTFNWTGNLGFMESEVVELPFSGPSDWMSYKPKKNFLALAHQPNGQTDQNPHNNWYKTTIKSAPVYPANLQMTIFTNNAAHENTWTLTRMEDGTVIGSDSNLTNNTNYTETLSLQPGCYLFHFTDSDKDGLAYQFNNDGSGNIRFRNDGGSFFLKALNSNFGTEIKHYFTVGYGIGLEEDPSFATAFNFYPNPTSGKLNLSIAAEGTNKLHLELFSLDGKKVLGASESFENDLDSSLDVSHLPEGLYTLKAQIGNDLYTKKLVIQ